MQLRDPRVNGVLECELVPPPWPRPSLNGGAVQLCALQWKGRGGGEEGRAQPKSGGPASPKGETLLAYMRSKRKETAKAKQVAAHHHQHRGEGGRESLAAARARAAAAVTARGGRERDGQMRSLGIQRSLGVDGNTGTGIPNACQTIIDCHYKLLVLLVYSVLSWFGSTFSSEERIECSSPLISGVSSVFLSFPPWNCLSWSPAYLSQLCACIW